MARGAQRDDWDRTSHLLSKIHNANCTEGNQQPPAFFNPYADDEEETVSVVSMDDAFKDLGI